MASSPPPQVEPLLPSSPVPLSELCASIKSKIDAFLAEKDVSPQLARVQTQTREAIAVIREALGRYTYVLPTPLKEGMIDQVW